MAILPLDDRFALRSPAPDPAPAPGSPGRGPVGAPERSLRASRLEGNGGPRVALVHLGNVGALGTTRRVAVWRGLLSSAGAEVVEVNLLGAHRRVVPSPVAAVGALRGTIVPETAVWSVGGAERALRRTGATAAVFVTPRAFHPRLAGVVERSVLDLQDLFSRSYLGRAAVDRRPGAAAAWRALARATARFERREHGVALVAAGWAEAQEMEATWIPNTLGPSVPASDISEHAQAPFDLVLFGKLTALPNLDALRRLAGWWPEVQAAVPGATLLVAGSGTSPEIRRTAAGCGWSLQGGFADAIELCARARVAVAPLRHANGIQNKLLEAAAAGISQVVSPQALRGLAPGFPAWVAETAAETAAAVGELLASPASRLSLARQAHAHVEAVYGSRPWVDTVRALVAPTS